MKMVILLLLLLFKLFLYPIMAMNSKDLRSPMVQFAEDMVQYDDEVHKIFLYSDQQIRNAKLSFTLKETLVKNGLEKQNIHEYKSWGDFGTNINQFIDQVVMKTNKSNIKGTLIFLQFGTKRSATPCSCGPMTDLQRNTCTKGDLILRKMGGSESLGMKEIIILLKKINTKEIVLFINSPCSTHLIQKIGRELKKIHFSKKILLISADSNEKLSSSIDFPYPFYKSGTEEEDENYMSINSFPDYLNFMQELYPSLGLNYFTYSDLNMGKIVIKASDYGFKNKNFKSKTSIKNNLDRKLTSFLREVNLENLVILIIQTEHHYRHPKYGDMFLNSFFENGVKLENFHIIQIKQKDENDPPIHLFGDLNDEFIPSEQIHSIRDNFDDFLKENSRVLLFIRGNDESYKLGKRWGLKLETYNMLEIEDLIFFFIQPLRKYDMLTMFVSRRGHVAQNRLLRESPDLKIISFYSEKINTETFEFNDFMGYDFNSVSPLFRIFTPSLMHLKYLGREEYYFEKAVKLLNIFVDMENFHDYLDFIKAASPMSETEISLVTQKDISVLVSENVGDFELKMFGLLPEVPPREWLRDE